MVVLLWVLLGAVLYIGLAGLVFFWIYTRPLFQELEGASRDHTPLVLGFISSFFWPIGALIWGAIFGSHKLMHMGDKVVKKREEIYS